MMLSMITSDSDGPVTTSVLVSTSAEALTLGGCKPCLVARRAACSAAAASSAASTAASAHHEPGQVPKERGRPASWSGPA